jgi:50S ribosomal protein L16 3-hydroxylase
VLEPGDMLYLPPGVPHHGEAVDACMTFSVGMRAPSRAELLGAWSDHLLEQLPEELRYADPDLRPATAAGEIDDAAADRLLAIFEEHRPTSRAQAADFLARFASEYRNAQRIAPPPKPPPPARIEATLEAGGCLRPHPFARLFWRRQGREAVLYVQGEAFGCSRKAAQLLCSDQPLAAGEVATLDEPGRWLLQELARRGYFVLERTGRRPR